MAAVGVLTTNWAVLEWLVDATLVYLINHPKTQRRGERVKSLKISFEQRMDLMKRCGEDIDFRPDQRRAFNSLITDMKTARHNRDTIVHGLSLKLAESGEIETRLFRFTNIGNEQRKIEAKTETIHKYAQEIFELIPKMTGILHGLLGPVLLPSKEK